MAYDRPLPYDSAPARPSAADARAVFGQVMGLVAFTVGFFALGAYIGRDLGGGVGIACFIGAIVLLFGLNVAVRRSESLAVTMLFGVGLLLGLALGPALNAYASLDPGILWQAGGATALFIAGFGAFGYATRRDLSAWARPLFWLLLALIVFGFVVVLVNIPGGAVIYALLGLALFAAMTIFDFNRLRRSGMESAVPIAAGIFLDIVNVFQFFLLLFSGGSRN